MSSFCLFKNKKQKQLEKEQSEKQFQKKLDIELKNAVDEIEKIRYNMFKTFCPINCDNCFSECIHFYKGGAFIQEIFETKVVMKFYPRCKLWQESC